MNDAVGMCALLCSIRMWCDDAVVNDDGDDFCGLLRSGLTKFHRHNQPPFTRISSIELTLTHLYTYFETMGNPITTRI